MSFVIISSSTEKSQEFANKLMDCFHQYADSLPEKTGDTNNKYWIRGTGESSMRRISFTMAASISTTEQGVVFAITYGYGMGSNMDCICSADRFFIGFKRLVKEKLGFETRCAKYDRNDSLAICGNPSIRLNVYIDCGVPFCFCVDPRHHPVSMGTDGCSYECSNSSSSSS